MQFSANVGQIIDWCPPFGQCPWKILDLPLHDYLFEYWFTEIVVDVVESFTSATNSVKLPCFLSVVFQDEVHHLFSVICRMRRSTSGQKGQRDNLYSSLARRCKCGPALIMDEDIMLSHE